MQLEAIKVSYIASLSEKRDVIDQHWQSLKADWLADTFDAVYLVIHGLAGSAETFGFPDITRQARKVVDQFKQLKSHAPPDDSGFISEIDQEIQTLLIIMENTSPKQDSEI